MLKELWKIQSGVVSPARFHGRCCLAPFPSASLVRYEGSALLRSKKCWVTLTRPPSSVAVPNSQMLNDSTVSSPKLKFLNCCKKNYCLFYIILLLKPKKYMVPQGHFWHQRHCVGLQQQQLSCRVCCQGTWVLSGSLIKKPQLKMSSQK